METLYDILKIREDAPQEIIKAAYKAMSSMFHPDKNPGDDAAAEMMKKVNAAYQILRDPELRSRYDDALKRARAQQQTAETQSKADEAKAQAGQTSTTHQRHQAPTTIHSFGLIMGRLWTGRMGLFKTYWGFGVLAGIIWGIPLGLVNSNTSTAISLVLICFIYFFVVNVGIWRAAGMYTGPAIWAILARGAVLLPIAGIVAAITLPTYQDYKTRSALQTQKEAQINWRDFTPADDKPVKYRPSHEMQRDEWIRLVQKINNDVKSGNIPSTSLTAIGTHHNLIPGSDYEASLAEAKQVWWKDGSYFRIFIENPTGEMIRAMEFKYNESYCNQDVKSEFYIAEIETPIKPGGSSLIVMDSIDKNNNNGCLVITRLYH